MSTCVSLEASEVPEVPEIVLQAATATAPYMERRPLVPLEEIIRRLQEITGSGKPPGRDRFSRETGIKNYDWHNLGLRWSDVVRMAGLRPYRFCRGGYKPEEIMESFASFTRELGQIPVQRDLMNKRRRDAGFPSPIVFNKYGNKGELVERVIAYCEKQGGWEDVINLCREWQPKYLDQLRSGKWAQDPSKGFVYLIRYGGYYKVGQSSIVDKRASAIYCQLPEGKGRLVHKIRTDDPDGIEDYWHRRFAAKRTNGEWFALAPEDVKAFRRRRSM